MGGEALVAARAAAGKFSVMAAMGITLAALFPWAFLSISLARRLPALACSVPACLLPPTLLALLSRPVPHLRIPAPPPSSGFEAWVAAVPSPRILGEEQLLAALQQATPSSWPSPPAARSPACPCLMFARLQGWLRWAQGSASSRRSSLGEEVSAPLRGASIGEWLRRRPTSHVSPNLPSPAGFASADLGHRRCDGYRRRLPCPIPDVVQRRHRSVAEWSTWPCPNGLH
jgi:hypothetical protein